MMDIKKDLIYGDPGKKVNKLVAVKRDEENEVSFSNLVDCLGFWGRRSCGKK